MPLFPDRLRFGIHAGQQYTDFPSYLELWRLPRRWVSTGLLCSITSCRSVGLDRRRDDIDVVNRESGFDPIEPGSGARFPALVHQTLDAGRTLAAGMDQEKAGRPPGLELPAENRLVELASTVDIIDVDGKGREVARHDDHPSRSETTDVLYEDGRDRILRDGEIGGHDREIQERRLCHEQPVKGVAMKRR